MLANVLASGHFRCQDGIEREFGSDTRAAELDAAMQAFGKLHRLFNRKEPLCEHEIKSFGPLVTEYACAFAKAYPDAQPTPKMHVLCYHMDELLERHGSIGMDTEQGIESFHPEVNYVRNLFRHLDRNQPAQLAAMATQVWARGAGASEWVEGMRAGQHARKDVEREARKSKKCV